MGANLYVEGAHSPFPLEQIQTEAVQKFIAAKKGSVTFATGIGKTAVALETIRQLMSDSRITNALFTVPRLALLDQFTKEAERWGFDSGLIGVFYGAKKDPRVITFCTYQSLIRYPELMDHYDFVIFDEVHIIVNGQEMGSLIDRSMERPYVMGMSATIPRSYGELRKKLPVIADASIRKGVEIGRLVQPRLIEIPVELNPEEWHDAMEATDQMQEAVVSLSRNGIIKAEYQIFKLTNHPEWRIKRHVFKFIGARARRNKILSSSPVKFKTVLELAKKHPTERMMVFAESVEAIEKLTKYLNANGVPAECISAKTKMSQRRKIFTDFGPSFLVLVSVKTLEIGVDLKMMGLEGDVGIAVIISSGRESIQLTQRMGRVLRKSEGKEEALIYVVYVPTFEKYIPKGVKRLIK